MLIAILSDTHMPRGARRLPDECVGRLGAVDLILHAGDVMTEEVFGDMEAIGPPLLGVHGNVDSSALRARLPAERIVEAEGARIAMLHDSGPAGGRLERLQARFSAVDAVVFGHSHMPLHEEADSFQIFNPGSPTERRWAPFRSMGMARIEGGRVSFELVELP